ncbi:hypothetical protein [Micrococcus cohnii]|uniref:Uncharacterized membrane protein YhaH (DUF805 family) n=1 Tax=Micrococcus cohnii TaxID=993416 RepID=A0A7W7GPA1_9MICC|nr:hypothetical protein [Micrococcus cohnii]MBB4735772.1 uncharacterized membrane protein YhaH (DUF805 family) [Micrococcus cohnii]
MAQNSNEHRLARAAGRAARSFKQNQAADEERLRERREQLRTEDERRLEERRADKERALDARDAAESGRVHPLLKLARRWWMFVTAVLAGLAAAFVYNGVRAGSGEVLDPLTGMKSVGPLGGATGQFTMAGVLGLIMLITLWGVIGLFRRRRSAVSTLTTLTVIVAVPSLLRGNALLIVLAALLVIGSVLVWLPPVRSRVRR